MKKMIRTAAAVAAFTVAGVGLAGVAGAADDPGYVPPACTDTVNGVETAVPCNGPAVEDTVVDPAAAEAVTATAGTLPYTGSNSSLPLAEAGVALLAGGGALLLVVKRRQASANS